MKIQACKNVLSGNVLLAIACMVVSCFGFGCEVDSFLDPSKTGYFEHTPTSMPILSRIDIIERETGYKPETTYPTPEDLVPNELQYRLAPGDVVTVEIYELVKANETDRSVRVIDQSGVIRLPTLGDVQAAGLTVQELQEAHRAAPVGVEGLEGALQRRRAACCWWSYKCRRAAGKRPRRSRAPIPPPLHPSPACSRPSSTRRELQHAVSSRSSP